MGKHLKLISVEYLQEYSNKVKVDWFEVFNKLKSKILYLHNKFSRKIMPTERIIQAKVKQT